MPQDQSAKRRFNMRYLQSKRTLILQLAAKYGASRVRVFGSVARNEVSQKSDVDFLVHMKKGKNYLDLVGLWLELAQLLHCKVDVISEGGISPYLKDQIIKEALPL